MPRILVTGAGGFIGRHLVPALLESGCEVIASSRSVDNIWKEYRFERVTWLPLDFATLDDSINYFDFFGRPDAMIHLTWEGLPNYTASFHTDINLPRHKMFLENLLRNGLSDLTITGTCLEYGMHEGKLDESMSANPASPYAKAKDLLREFLYSLQQRYNFSLKWIRLFYMYGAGQNPKSLFSQLEKAVDEGASSFNMSGGEQVRDYLPVSTVAEYISRIALQKKVQGIINCCSGQPVTVKELVESYLRERQSRMQLNLGYYPYTNYEPMAFWGDTNKLESILINE